MKLSIIIVNYNVQHYLELCLDSVVAATRNIDSEVIVVDNASVDESVAMLVRKFPDVIVITNTSNLGFSKANNLGVGAATGEYICILNPDTVLGEHVFDEVFAFAKAKKTPGIIGVRLVDGTGHFLPESKRNIPTPSVSLKKILGYDSAYYDSKITVEGSGEVAVLVGAFMFLKKTSYLEIGGFDERYFMYGEDIDLSYSILKQGYKNYYLGASTIIHFKGESTIKNKVYRERFFGAMTLFYTKYFKRNKLEQLLVQVGVKVALLKSILSLKIGIRKDQLEKYSPTAYILVSNQEILLDRLQVAVSKPIRIAGCLKHFSAGEEVFFDASYVSYIHIIKEIITHKHSGLTFKIIPKNSTFAVGSNSSDGRGDIIHFGEEN
ncbi:glycosyltransferase family 2 protein [Dokdonia sp. Hel_I_53]|uniref:glycosyltransferase family 2 protein n=1 Tax=Dokdonia sp. Hel_I_53 TaxID=1566287 RepID=UPI00119B0EEA|nr:glycosyltransferase family 2 protein [Dokdonia sp. Hel_I_53]TVZ53285.1 GT2 family glycosyltransferase [Dokdonia sp. Hel_I_53]